MLLKIVVLAVSGSGQALNYIKCYFSATVKSGKSYGKPILLNIEPTNVCDLKCPVCETGAGNLERSQALMTYENFRSIIDQFDDSLRIIYFYFMGESFLNKDAYRMIRYAADRGIYVSACTNGNKIIPQELVQSGIADIQFQIAGTTNEVHQIYRNGGCLENIFANIRETIRVRKELAKSVPRSYPLRIGLGYILMKHNEHQVSDLAALAASLGVDEHTVIDPCVRSIEQGQRFLPSDRKHWAYDPVAFANNELKMRTPHRNYCEWIYSTVTVQVDGNVVPCCRDPKGKWILGNLHKDNIYNIWNNEKYRGLRKSIAVSQGTLWLCKLCDGYRLPFIQ